MVYIWYYLSVFLFTWYSAKLLKNKMTDQYWHVPQVLFLVVVYTLPFFLKYDTHYLIKIIFLGLQFPLLFNVGLNAYRRQEIGSGWITHLGKYDKFTFEQTAGLFLIGMTATLFYGIKGG